MGIQMEALRTFAGTEGFFRKGDQFEVRDMSRAKSLSEAGLAKMVDDQETAQQSTEEQPISEVNIPSYETTKGAEPPPQGETWGVKALGGGWYELPGGETTQGFDLAREHLYIHLQREFEPEVAPIPKDAETPAENAEVRLIEPVTEPRIVFTGEPEETESTTSSEDPSNFDDDVKYLGGGWYELPNGERVQGKESAKDVYDAYFEERG